MSLPILTILPGCANDLLNPVASVLLRWPQHLNHPLAWHGNDFTTEDQYICLFSSYDKSQIQSALDHFKSLELDGSDITEQNFPLPNLGERLHALSEGLHHGKGFFMLRGLDPTEFSVEDNSLLYLCLSSYIAPTCGKQDEEGNMFLHIREAKEMAAPQTERSARDSNARLAFHTDQFPDILALYCHGRAETGGNHNIASSYAIYNELSITRPDVLETLASPDWYFDSLFVHPERRPLLFNYQGHIILNFGRIHLMATEPTDDGTFAPKPTAKQLEALDLVQQLAEKHHLSLNMDPGDLTFINNLGILHAREEFTDSPEHTRHLVRMWLKNEDKAWPLPRTLKRGNDRTYDMATEEIWNILPAPRVAFKIREKYGP
ncbi:Clavaminate synthase [Fusarium agapanthi]|uniref:Clavaminate synthase n=1 Tax=Fusarium agapanthi TaxID=1803897 RepID=A0A9P5ECP8_9HYPO|nr:Clavaminate synthase [Fusarium agapanthi]